MNTLETTNGRHRPTTKPSPILNKLYLGDINFAMSIDAIKSKFSQPTPNQQPKKIKGDIKLKVHGKTTARRSINKTFLGLLIIITIGVVAVIWFLSLKMNWQRVNQNESPATVENASDISAIKDKFNDVFNQTSAFINDISANAGSMASSSDLSTSTNDKVNTEPSLSEEQIEEISDNLKQQIETNNN